MERLPLSNMIAGPILSDRREKINDMNISFQVVLNNKINNNKNNVYRCFSVHLQSWARYIYREDYIDETWIDISMGWVRFSYYREQRGVLTG